MGRRLVSDRALRAAIASVPTLSYELAAQLRPALEAAAPVIVAEALRGWAAGLVGETEERG